MVFFNSNWTWQLHFCVFVLPDNQKLTFFLFQLLNSKSFSNYWINSIQCTIARALLKENKTRKLKFRIYLSRAIQIAENFSFSHKQDNFSKKRQQGKESYGKVQTRNLKQKWNGKDYCYYLLVYLQSFQLTNHCFFLLKVNTLSPPNY